LVTPTFVVHYAHKWAMPDIRDKRYLTDPDAGLTQINTGENAMPNYLFAYNVMYFFTTAL
jgi:hypothetical protein